MTKPKLREDCIHINVCHVIGEYGTKGCVKSCPEYIPHSSAKSSDVLEERLVQFHSELKGLSEIELVDEQKELTDGLKEALETLYRWFPELRTKEREQG